MPTYADLQQLDLTNSNSSGAFTRYGDVLSLLQSADDKFVIGREADTVSLQFPVDTSPVPTGMVRDYFVIASCWFKGKGLSYVPFTVDPLPFQAMTSFPYPTTESYPFDRQPQSLSANIQHKDNQLALIFSNHQINLSSSTKPPEAQ